MGETGRVGLGLRALKGGGWAVAMRLDGGEPNILLSAFIPTAAEGDRLALEPYGVAYGMARGPDGKASAEAAAVVAEGLRRQGDLAARGLGAIVGALRGEGYGPIAAALLVNRAGWITDALEYSLGWPEHVPVAEGLAVRDALRTACSRNGLDVAELDEKSLQDVATATLGLSGEALDARLKELGASAGKPWRKEQKLTCLAAWIVAVERSRA